jgi:hypothetical protein
VWVGLPTTNLLTSTCDFSTATWAANLFNNWVPAIRIAGAGEAPDGTNTATKLTGNWPNYCSNVAQRISCSPSTTYTFSVWLKDIDTNGTIYIAISTGLNNSLVTEQAAITYCSSFSNWKRYSVSYTTPASGVNQIEGMLYNLANTKSILVWGGQIEQQAFATPFVNGTRGVSTLYLPIVKAQNANFTISIQMFGKANPSGNPSDIFCDDADRWNGQLRSDQANDIELLVRANGRGATANLYGTLPITSLNTWNRYTLVSIAGYGTKIYQNANLVLDAQGYYTQYNALSVGRNGMGDAAVKSAMFKNLMITDTALSQAQIADICNTQP